MQLFPKNKFLVFNNKNPMERSLVLKLCNKEPSKLSNIMLIELIAKPVY